MEPNLGFAPSSSSLQNWASLSMLIGRITILPWNIDDIDGL